MSIITSHADLAAQIAGKKILHLNSLGKDAILTLEWLVKFAHCAEIVSVHYASDTPFPTDEGYWKYLKRRYPTVRFIKAAPVWQINDRMDGYFQSPLWINYVMANQDFWNFNVKQAHEDLRLQLGMDYICSGLSCYEGMGRAMYLRRVGLLHSEMHTIYPIGLMKLAQVTDLIKKLKLPLNPSYKLSPESYDTASYWRMRNGFIARPEFRETVYKLFPLVALDEFRCEVLFHGKA
jgi:hypothetical protein